MKLAAKVAIVTGAAQGIGLACAQRLVREGARVMLVDVRPEGAAAAAQLGADARFFQADVGVKAEVDAMLAAGPAANYYNPDLEPVKELLRELKTRPKLSQLVVERDGFRLAVGRGTG